MNEYYMIKPFSASGECPYWGQYKTIEEAINEAKKYIEKHSETLQVHLYHTKITELDIIIKPKK